MNLLDRVIGYFAPGRAIARIQARATLQQIEAATSSVGGYAAGRRNRLNRASRGSAKEYNVPAEQVERMRASAWAAYRDNPYAKKITRAIEAKVIGPAMVPESLAVLPNGTAFTAFRNRCKQLWEAVESGFDINGLPGQGGLTMSGLQRLALRANMLSGNTLYRLVPLDPAEAIRRDIPVPMALQFIDVARLADDVPVREIPDGHILYRGIEFDSNGQRVRYWIDSERPGSVGFSNPKPISASELHHLFIQDDIDQPIGVTWFCASLLPMRDTRDMEYNVTTSAAMASCVAMGYRKPSGKTRWGLNASADAQSGTADGTDLTDADGNTITKMQPGMIVNLGTDGALETFSPNQPNMNPEGFVQHMLRGVAAGLPALKSSTLIGDYRQSSFSSEKSADNDIWPEVSALQEWFATGFCQPVYEAILRAAVLSGYFDGIITAEEFQANRQNLVKTKWQGPVSQSINPEKDVAAAAARIQYGLSSPQMECAKLNVNWRDVIADNAEFYSTAAAAGLPEEVINNVFSVDVADVSPSDSTPAEATAAGAN